MDELTQAWSILHKNDVWPGNTSKKLNALERIAELGRPLHAWWLLEVILRAKPEIAFAAAETVRQLMLKAKPQEWVSLHRSFHLATLQPEDVQKFAQLPARHAVHPLGIASMNDNGYVREAAVRQLRAIGLPEILPYLILRLTDWVPQVRILADTLVQEFLDRGLVLSVVEIAPFLKWMERVERVDLTAIRVRLIQSLRTSDRQQLLAGLSQDNVDVRLLCFQILLPNLANESEVVEKGLRDPSTKVRFWLLNQIVAQRPQQAVAWLSILSDDPFPGIRLAVVHALATQWPDAVQTVLPRMIFDESSSVRDATRFYLARNGTTDLIQRYRDQLKQAVSAGTIAGLGETGVSEDFDSLIPLITHQNAKVRAAALQAIARLDIQKAIPILLQFMNDSNSRVRRTLVNTWLHANIQNQRDLLLPVLESDESVSALAALMVLSELRSWEGFRDILYAMNRQENTLSRCAWRLMEIWIGQHHNNLYTRPSPSLLPEIQVQAAKVVQANTDQSIYRQYIIRAIKDMVSVASAQ